MRAPAASQVRARGASDIDGAPISDFRAGALNFGLDGGIPSPVRWGRGGGVSPCFLGYTLIAQKKDDVLSDKSCEEC